MESVRGVEDCKGLGVVKAQETEAVSRTDEVSLGMREARLDTPVKAIKRTTGFLDLPSELHLAIFRANRDGWLSYIQCNRARFCLISQKTLPAALAALYDHLHITSAEQLERLHGQLVANSDLQSLPHHFDVDVKELDFHLIASLLELLSLRSICITLDSFFSAALSVILPNLVMASQLKALQSISINAGVNAFGLICCALRDLGACSVRHLEFTIGFERSSSRSTFSRNLEYGIQDEATKYSQPAPVSTIAYLSLDCQTGLFTPTSAAVLFALLAAIPSSIDGLRLSLWCDHVIPSSFWNRLPLLKHLAITLCSDTLFTVAPQSFPCVLPAQYHRLCSSSHRPTLSSLWCERFEDYIYLDLPESLQSLRISTENAEIVVDGLTPQRLPNLRLVVLNYNCCNGDPEEESVEAMRKFCEERKIELCTEAVLQEDWYDCESFLCMR